MELFIKDLKIGDIDEEWIKENCYIAGGACVSRYLGQKINDIDIYFKSKEAIDYFIDKTGFGEYYIKKDSLFWQTLKDWIDKGSNKKTYTLKNKDYDFYISDNEKDKVYKITESKTGLVVYSISEDIFKKQKWCFNNGYEYILSEREFYEVKNGCFLGNKSITLSKKIPSGDMRFQFILKFYGTPKEMMDKTFDFQHCKIAFDFKSGKYIADDETFKCLRDKKIIYTNSYYPLSSIKRLFKYKERGFYFPHNEFIKILKDIQKIDLNNNFLLEDQMVGYYEDFDYDAVFWDKDFLETVFRG